MFSESQPLTNYKQATAWMFAGGRISKSEDPLPTARTGALPRSGYLGL